MSAIITSVQGFSVDPVEDARFNQIQSYLKMDVVSKIAEYLGIPFPGTIHQLTNGIYNGVSKTLDFINENRKGLDVLVVCITENSMEYNRRDYEILNTFAYDKQDEFTTVIVKFHDDGTLDEIYRFNEFQEGSYWSARSIKEDVLGSV